MLEFIKIVSEEAMLILSRNTTFIIPTLFSTVPLFCFLLFYEPLLQRTLVEALERLASPRDSKNWLMTMVQATRELTEEYGYKFIQLGLLYLLPLHFLQYCTAVLTVNLASKETQASPNATAKKLSDRIKFISSFSTSMITLFLSTSYLLASMWLAANYYIILNKFVNNAFCSALYRAACVALLVKYLEWSTVWNLGVVVSILKETNGATDALMFSIHLSRGWESQGLLLVFAFFVWEFGLQFTCFQTKCHERGLDMVALVSLLCIGNLMKWVAWTVYFQKCKETVEKEVVVEV